jgi:hypothetical protein
VAQDTRVVVEHLDEDVPPEPAQPLAILDHGDRSAGRLIDRLERLRRHPWQGNHALNTRSREAPGVTG